MKKSLFMFSIFVLLLIFVTNIYGASGDHYYDLDSAYNEALRLFNNNRENFDSDGPYFNDFPDEINFDDFVNNNIEFKKYLEIYPYYVIFPKDGAIRCSFMKSKPYIKIFNSDDRYVTVSFSFENNQDSWYRDCYIDSTTGNLNFYPNTSIEILENRSHAGTFHLYNHYGYGIMYSRTFVKNCIYSNVDLKFENGTNFKKTEFSFIPTYSENYKTCNLKLNIKNAPEYYTLKYAINSSSSTWYDFDNSTGVTVEENCLVIVKMLDDNGDEIFANSYNVTMLENQVSSTYFKVDFDTSQKSYLGFTPILYNNSHEMFDIKFSLDVASDNLAGGSKVGFSEKNTSTTLWKYYTNILDYDCQHGHTYWLRANGGSTVYLKFELYNKHTGILALTREFEFKLSYDYSTAVSSSTNGVKDSIFNSGANSSLDDNLLSTDSLDINWDLNNSKDTIKSFFETAISFFKLVLAFVMLMPAWITVPLYTLFILSIVIFVFHVIRG